jgi:predicted nucleotidyltransferase
MTHDRSQFALWEAALQRRRAANEAERRRVLADLLAWLDARGAEHDIDQAWIFGSLTRPGRFGARSDVDLALARDPSAQQFRIMSALSLALDHDVDVILIDDCPFAGKIIREGIQWTRSRSVR